MPAEFLAGGLPPAFRGAARDPRKFIHGARGSGVRSFRLACEDLAEMAQNYELNGNITLDLERIISVAAVDGGVRLLQLAESDGCAT